HLLSPFLLSCPSHHPHLHSFPHDALPISAFEALDKLVKKLIGKYLGDLIKRTSRYFRRADGEEYTCIYPPEAICHSGYKHVAVRSEEHTSELQSRFDLVCRLLLEKKKHYKGLNKLRRYYQIKEIISLTKFVKYISSNR